MKGSGLLRLFTLFFLMKHFQYDTRKVTSKYYDKLLLNLSQFTMPSSTLQSKQLRKLLNGLFITMTDFLEGKIYKFYT